NIVTPNLPLPDGAVINLNEKLIAAACYLPLSEIPFISKELGTRHRAVVRISEVMDAITIVLFEETGHISCTKSGDLHRELSEEDLKNYLLDNLSTNVKAPVKKSWNWRGRKNG